MKENVRKIDGYEVEQLRLPHPEDSDPHPRLVFQGYGIHAGDSFTAWLPGGWQDITLEVAWSKTGADCWYISTDGFTDICPVGLWVKI